MTLVFEFLNNQGALVTSQEVAVPPLAAGATAPIVVSVTGAGIASWRYHPKWTNAAGALIAPPACSSFSAHAGVAQLVEHQLPKLRVAGSNPVVRLIEIFR